MKSVEHDVDGTLLEISINISRGVWRREGYESKQGWGREKTKVCFLRIFRKLIL